MGYEEVVVFISFSPIRKLISLNKVSGKQISNDEWGVMVRSVIVCCCISIQSYRKNILLHTKHLIAKNLYFQLFCRTLFTASRVYERKKKHIVIE